MVTTNVVDDNRLSPILIISLDYKFSCDTILFLFLSFLILRLKLIKFYLNDNSAKIV